MGMIVTSREDEWWFNTHCLFGDTKDPEMIEMQKKYREYLASCDILNNKLIAPIDFFYPVDTPSGQPGVLRPSIDGEEKYCRIPIRKKADRGVMP